MAQERAIVRVHGVLAPENGALGPLLPLVLEINVEKGSVQEGDLVNFVVQGRVQSLTPNPINAALAGG